MSVVFAVLIFCVFGTLTARQPDRDINRIKLLPKEVYHRTSNIHSRRSVITDHLRRHDRDNNSSRFAELRSPMLFLDNAPSITKATTEKVYQPREDPRLFYQSDAYIKEINRKKLKNEVTSIYLGRGVIQARNNEPKSMPIRLKENEIYIVDDGLCIRCPHDRTLIAKNGVDRALLQYPRILTCSGLKAPRIFRFSRIQGPEFDTLLKKGSYTVVGQISLRGQVLKTCRMQVHVLLQSCSVPKYLVSHCEAQNKSCSFTCRDTKAKLRGHKMLTCGNDMLWSGRLPVCNARTSCPLPHPPEHGTLNCKGITLPKGSGLVEGSSCRVKCAKGWRRSPRASIAVCRRGHWTHALSCQPKRN